MGIPCCARRHALWVMCTQTQLRPTYEEWSAEMRKAKLEQQRQMEASAQQEEELARRCRCPGACPMLSSSSSCSCSTRVLHVFRLEKRFVLPCLASPSQTCTPRFPYTPPTTPLVPPLEHGSYKYPSWWVLHCVQGPSWTDWLNPNPRCMCSTQASTGLSLTRIGSACCAAAAAVRPSEGASRTSASAARCVHANTY